MERRKKLSIAILFLAATGVVSLSEVFIGSLKPTDALRRERTLLVDLGQIPENSYKIFDWNGRKIAIFRPGRESSEYLVRINKFADGPDYTDDSMPRLFAYEPLSTFRGCMLSEIKKNKNLVTGYIGWYDPCHMGVWDFSGRNIPGEFTPEGISLPNLDPVTNYTWRGGSIIEFIP